MNVDGYSFYLRIKESLTEKIIFKKNSKGDERANHAGVWKKSVPGREGKCKGLLGFFKKASGRQCGFSYIVNENRRNRVRVLVMRRSRTLLWFSVVKSSDFSLHVIHVIHWEFLNRRGNCKCLCERQEV